MDDDHHVRLSLLVLLALRVLGSGGLMTLGAGRTHRPVVAAGLARLVGHARAVGCDWNVVVMGLASDLGPWFPQGEAAP